ncbi:putative ankyrin repeat protein RF_0381 [Microplitis mediator]|uniref:putative ankyrin repeat protein RF_0381 n=1 Tax=Microplitis mediator TaxID=375433 RepID=UPI0025548F92|nr:putative ankyrin repeat protein RF_0381 [Microplitis mediator]XP_057325712.1 putative ankyrin repeat protein RF_0381 [Microplitis mediator]XP_057325713.1 putative ankyrin repeat protein RF_0381 [Microplitis mediator]
MSLTNGAHVYIQNNHGNTALHRAIKENQFNAAKLLISSQGIDVNVIDDDGMTPIHLATARGYLDIVQYLLSNRACIDVPCTSNWKNGYTPLHLAAESGNEEITSLLLWNGANANSKALNSLTPLHLAAERGHLRIVELLLDYGAFIDCAHTSALRFRCTPLHFAVENGYAKVAEFLVNKGANVNVKRRGNDTPLLVAAERGHLAIVQCLLKHGAHINGTYVDEGKAGYTPLHIACKNNHDDVVEYLLSEGADSNLIARDNLTAIHLASMNGNDKILILLLGYGADVNICDTNKKPIYHNLILSAIKEGHLKIVKYLLIHKVLQNNLKRVPTRICNLFIHCAVQNKREEIVKLLVAYGADVNAKDKFGKPVLFYAIENCNLKIVELLMKSRIRVDNVDKKNRTALHVACENGRLSIVELLLQNNFDVNRTCKKNYTPLDYASASYRFSAFNFPEGSDRELIIEALKQHIIKLKIANLYVSEKNLSLVILDDRMMRFQTMCENEIENMKTEKVGSSNVSFYDILTKSTNQLSMFVRNESIFETLSSNNYKRDFLIYGNIISHCFSKGLERFKLVEQGSQCFHTIFDNFDKLPYNCTKKIYDFLGDSDFINLIIACKSHN